MATNTKIQFKYGQWLKEQAIEMSKVAGVVVYSGKTRGIYVDGKEFVSGEGSDRDIQNIASLLGAIWNPSTGLYELRDLENLPEGVEKDVTSVLNSLTSFRANMHVDEYAQATIISNNAALPADKASQLTIFSIGQGSASNDNDGKIYHNGANDLVINIAGQYDDDNNPLATKETVTTAVSALRAEIFGTLTPEELDKTIDSIKEIQQMLKGGDFVKWTHKVINPQTGETEEKVDNVIVLPVKDEEGKIVSYNLPKVDEDGKPIKDEDGKLIPSETVIVSYDEEGKEVYAEGTDELGEYKYSDLQHTENVQELLKDIDNIEKKNLVATISLDPNKDNNFVNYNTVSDTDENGLTTQTATIGVKYGTFKTGHGNVMDETSSAYIDGIATVEDVQKYIEERLTWVEFVSDTNELTKAINAASGDSYSLNQSQQLGNNMLIK